MTENDILKPPEIEVSLFYLVAMLIASCFASVLIAWHFSLTSFSLIPDTIFLPIGCMFTVVSAYCARDSSTPLPAKIPLILIGIYLGFILNIFLSVDFLANPSFPAVFVDSLVVIIGLTLILKMIKKPFEKPRYVFLFEKLRCVFLGVSLLSIVFAFSAFLGIVQGYLPLLPELKMIPSGFVHFDFSLIVNIFKSLFLTGLFSFLERLLRIVEEANSLTDCKKA